MHLTRLTVTNFRRFASETFTFAPSMNAVAGNNGSGKTALLDAIASALSPFLPESARRLIGESDVRVVYQTGHRQSANGDLPQPTRLEPQSPVTLQAEGQINGPPTNWQVSLPESAAPVKFAISDPLPLIAYYRARRHWTMVNEPVEAALTPAPSRLDGYAQCLDASASDAALVRWFMREALADQQRNLRGEASLGIHEAMVALLVSCLEDIVEIYYDIEMGSVLARTAAGDRLPIGFLSDGQRAMLGLYLDLSMRAVLLNPQFGSHAMAQTPGIVLIDEVDLHIHPRWQRRVLDDLRRCFPAVQFVVSTHAPLILQSLRDGELIDLRGSDAAYANQPPEDILEDVMGVPVPQRSRHSEELIKRAEKYLALTQDPGSSEVERQEAKRRMEEIEERYADNEAYVALLRTERLAAGVD